MLMPLADAATTPVTIGWNTMVVRLLACFCVLVVALGCGVLLSSRGIGFPTHDIFFNMRLPRIIMAAIAGGALAGAGVAFQALLGNPLADPYIIGVSGGAAVGGTIALLILPSALFVPLLSFSGAVAAATGAYLFARRMGGSAFQILMTGVVVNAFASSTISFIKTVVGAAKAQEILFWLMGTLGYPTWLDLGITAGLVGIGLTVLVILSPRMNVLSFGDSSAAAMGVNVVQTRTIAFIAGSLIVGAVVSQVGMIGFVGLVIPHLLRLLWGPDHRLLFPGSVIIGAAAVVLADALARFSFLMVQTTLPVGVITSFIGGPFFVILLWKNRRGWSTL